MAILAFRKVGTAEQPSPLETVRKERLLNRLLNPLLQAQDWWWSIVGAPIAPRRPWILEAGRVRVEPEVVDRIADIAEE